jgi:magnesium chelatase subunit D
VSAGAAAAWPAAEPEAAPDPLPDAWTRAALALAVLAVDPGLGLAVRARAGPVRDRWLAGLARLAPGPILRLHPAMDAEALTGGLDLAATLSAGRPVRRAGLMARPGTLLMPMAERCPPDLAGRLAAALDGEPGRALVALDEGAGPDEALPPALAERLALRLDLGALPLAEAPEIETDPADLARARARLADVALPKGGLADLAALSLLLGVGSSRALHAAARAARALAALLDLAAPGPEEMALAVQLTLAPRATQAPPAPEPNAPPEPPPEPPDPAPDDAPRDARSEEIGDAPPPEMLLEAARAVLPPGLLDGLAAARGAAAGSGAGARRIGPRHGRPLPSRPGRPEAGRRLDLVATLRAAAPWQAIRGRRGPLRLAPADLRIRRHEERGERLVIFCVDASGSAAAARLAEAKGAVELLLAEAYARRDGVALVAFRGDAADLLLPPTRSLVAAKRRLAALPGGGATPLAAGLAEALAQARLARRRGLDPALVLMTDGRPNVALDGARDRARAGEDATRLARLIAADGLPALVIDTGPRPAPALRALAAAMGAPHLPMPRAEPARLSRAVEAAL